MSQGSFDLDDSSDEGSDVDDGDDFHGGDHGDCDGVGEVCKCVQNLSFRYHFLDTETSFFQVVLSACSPYFQQLFSENSCQVIFHKSQKMF